MFNYSNVEIFIYPNVEIFIYPNVKIFNDPDDNAIMSLGDHYIKVCSSQNVGFLINWFRINFMIKNTDTFQFVA